MKNLTEFTKLLFLFFTMSFAIYTGLSVISLRMGYELRAIYYAIFSAISLNLMDMFSFNLRLKNRD